LLRDEPTQTGTAFPKFYLWVWITRPSGAIDEGAVRVAAINRTHFEVTHFVPDEAVRSNPDEIANIFPPPVADKIAARVSSR
jgi:hypothetical protein